MVGSVPDLRRQIAAFLGGTIDLERFELWLIMSETDIEQRGTDDEVDFLNTVENILAEYTGDHISAEQHLDALREEYGLGRSKQELAVTSG